MHNKFFVLDSQQVWTGSTNLSDTELGGEYNSDVAALLSSYELAEIYQGEFNEMYGGFFHSRKADNTRTGRPTLPLPRWRCSRARRERRAPRCPGVRQT